MQPEAIARRRRMVLHGLKMQRRRGNNFPIVRLTVATFACATEDDRDFILIAMRRSGVYGTCYRDTCAPFAVSGDVRKAREAVQKEENK